MANDNYGFTGRVGEVAWAQGATLFAGRDYCVDRRTSLAATVTGTRVVNLAAGWVYGKGVWTRCDATTVNVPAPLSGSGGQWFLIVARRTWGVAPTFVFTALAGPATGTTVAAPPASFPAGSGAAFYQTNPGVVDDVPLYWAWSLTGSTSLVMIDLRDLPAGVPRRGTAAQRDAFYGVPGTPAATVALQGSTWYNTEINAHETYWAAYDATSNAGSPTGAAGWYPPAGTYRAAMGRSQVTVQLGGTFSNIGDPSWWTELERVGFDAFNDGWVAPIAGRYLVEGAIAMDAYGCYAGVTVDNTSYTTDTFEAQNGGPLVANTSTAQFSKVIRLRKGQRVRIAALCLIASPSIAPISTNIRRSYLNLSYVGPARNLS
jgi:hypothetical protein